MTDEQITARRITMDEYAEYCAGKTEYLNGKIMVGGTELFVGVKEFQESVKASERWEIERVKERERAKVRTRAESDH